ncbi:MAG: hypothetical protein HY904_05850 [Deltaproteobacteria bacterium]|nr:hypothetical protein [Deltaproteobacteria bacterium]
MAPFALALLLAAADAPSPPPAERPRKLLVLPLQVRDGIPEHEVTVLNDLLTAEARRIPGHDVMAQADLEQMLSLEMKQQLAGCEATSCLAEVAGALQADEVLYGTVGRLGELDLIMTLTRIAPNQARALGGESERLKGTNRAAMLDAVPAMLKRMYPAYVPPEPRVKPLPRPLLIGLSTGSGTVMQYALVSSMLAPLTMFPCPIAALCCSCLATAGCCAGPTLISAWQAWLGDLMGRRQAGYRWAAVVGTVLLVVMGGGTVFMSGMGALTAWLVGAPLWNYNPQRKNMENLLLLFLPFQAYRELNLAAIGAMCGGWSGLACLLVVVPFTQSVVLAAMGRVRPPEMESAPPGLYAAWEDVPWYARWLPGRLVGGRPESVVDLDDAPQAPPAQ